MDDAEPHARRARELAGTIRRALGAPYRVAWNQLDAESLREVERMIRDVEEQLRQAKRIAREPWLRM